MCVTFTCCENAYQCTRPLTPSHSFNAMQFQFSEHPRRKVTELEAFYYWYHILLILFRGTHIKLRMWVSISASVFILNWHCGSGETVSVATKMQRRENEVACGESAAGTTGHKIDMLIATPGDVNETLVELAANEHKREDIPDEDAYEQQNKNIRTNACILSQLQRRFGIPRGRDSEANPMVIEAIGNTVSSQASVFL